MNVENEKLLESDIENNWFVFYTSPRAEKIAQRELSFQGYEVFLPMTKTLRIWKNRQKKILDQVLFPSYIFVYTQECYLHKICQIPKIMTFIHCGGKPSIIRGNCIESLKKMLNLNQKITVSPNFNEGENVRVILGPLAGYEGILLRQKTKTKFGLQLKEISQTVLIDICTSFLKRI